MGVFGDLIRNCLHQSGLPLMFWVFAAEFAAKFYNMTIAPYKKSSTPYAKRYPGRKLPTIFHFGQLVTYVPKDIEKHSSRSRRGIIVGYSQLPGGIVTNEFRVIPLECFVRGLKSINIITTRDVRFSPEPSFKIREWNLLSESRKYIEDFKPLYGEQYFKNVWEKSLKDPIYKDPLPIKVYEDGNIHELEDYEDDDQEDDDSAVDHVSQPTPSIADQKKLTDHRILKGVRKGREG